MTDGLKQVEAVLFLKLQRRPPAGVVERTSFWLLVLLAVCFVLRLLPGAAGRSAGTLAGFVSAALLCFSAVLGFRWVTGRVLWTVRNRLIVTYLLMGLAPVVLFGTVAAIAAYAFSGQFAIDTAQQAIQGALRRSDMTASVAGASLLHKVEEQPNSKAYRLPVLSPDASAGSSGDALVAWYDAVRIPLSAQRQPGAVQVASLPDAQPPAWLNDAFRGLVRVGDRLYLCAVSKSSDDRHSLLSVAFSPLDAHSLADMAQGLGSISIVPNLSEDAGGDGPRSFRLGPGANFIKVQGGTIPPQTHLLDPPVYFGGRIEVTEWRTGESSPAVLGVMSRTSLLYSRLFVTSAPIGAIVRVILIGIGSFFGLIELLALFFAIRLSRTITQSVADLYGATIEIDRGNLRHRIRVERNDQLGALATSFNVMSGSLEHLLEQQREKERIQGELAIAQEVQNNLFPHVPILLPSFELYGICKPARSVSGDYYDFIHAGDEVCLALGDISGKGISAALLMASLHSAVRAYRLVSGGSDANGGGTASPAQLLALLNRHLYSTTQPEKYATLFLGCYSSAERTFTYANGGQLPPFLLRAGGAVERLTCGGSVVGLLEDLRYEQASVRLEPGDLFVAYSDGVTEPENEFGEFGEERLLALMRRHRHQPLASISAEAMRALRNWIGSGEQPDDITLVLARQL